MVGISGKIDGLETVPGILCIDCALDLVDLLPWDSIDNPDLTEGVSCCPRGCILDGFVSHILLAPSVDCGDITMFSVATARLKSSWKPEPVICLNQT